MIFLFQKLAVCKGISTHQRKVDLKDINLVANNDIAMTGNCSNY
jgi:hypothetical protein